MLNKFMYLVHYSLKKKFKSKSFIIVNVILVVLLVSICNIDSIINYFGGDFKEESVIYLLNDTSYQVKDTFESNFNSAASLMGTTYENEIVVFDGTIEEAKEKVMETSNVLLYFEDDIDNYLKVTVISYEKIDSLFYQNIVQSLNSTKQQIALLESSIDLEELNKVSSAIVIDRVILDDNSTTEEENMDLIMGTVFPTLILPFFMLSLFLVQIIGGEINEEKQTRSMEVIISNVTPNVHFFSKVLSANIFVITQSVLLFAYGAVGLGIRKLVGPSLDTGGLSEGISLISSSLSASGIMDKLIYIIPLTIILIILSFLAYSLIAGILASMTVSIDDFQQIQTPIIFISLIGYYLSIVASMFDGSMFIRILSYVPLISCLLSPALLIVGQIGIIDVMISILMLIILIFIFIKYGMKVYKIGILNYSTDKMWKKIFKAVREKG